MRRGFIILFNLLICLLMGNSYGFSQNFCASRVIMNAKEVHLVKTSDIDSDGDHDIVSATGDFFEEDNKIVWHESDGDGNFKNHTITNNEKVVMDIASADLDQDGDIDIVASSWDKFFWFENDGNQNFSNHTISTQLSYPIDLEVEDINRDGAMDIAACLNGKDKVVWYKNDGSENFTRMIVDSSFNEVNGLFVEDLNKDGYKDVVATSTIAFEMIYYKNNGHDSFISNLISRDKHRNIGEGDFDQDGEIDIVTSFTFDDEISWFQNDGQENFSEYNVTNQTVDVDGVLPLDLDSDGDLDIVSASNEVYWHENDGNGNFTDHLITANIGGSDINAADFDRDGDKDVALVNEDKGKVYWFENKFLADTMKKVACGSYTVPGTNKTYNSSGVYTHRIKRSAPCDSFLVIDLTIKNNAYNAISPKVCNQYTVPSGDETYTGSGRYRDTLPSSNGCDSILTIDLEVKNRDTIYPSVCDSFMVPSGDETYTQSGFYHDTIPGSSGCDSLIGIQLEMINRYSLDTSVCDSFWVPSGDEVYTKTGQYTDTLENQQGCDSIIDINLNLQKSRVTINPDACHEYILPSGGETYTSSGKYWDTLTNVHNCDSILNINLNIIEVDTGVTKNGTTLRANASGAQYRWLRCEDDGYSSITGAFNKTYEPFSNGRYAVEVTQNGCKDTSACVEVTSVGFKPGLSKRETFKIEPNPAEEKITVTFEKALSKGKITIKALDGRTLKTVPDAKGKQIGINISGLAKGVYGLVVTNEKGTRVRKLMKK